MAEEGLVCIAVVIDLYGQKVDELSMNERKIKKLVINFLKSNSFRLKNKNYSKTMKKPEITSLRCLLYLIKPKIIFSYYELKLFLIEICNRMM